MQKSKYGGVGERPLHPPPPLKTATAKELKKMLSITIEFESDGYNGFKIVLE